MTTWSFVHEVEAAAEPEQAWAFWTDVSNWRFDPSLESVTLEPGFVTGARGVTRPRGGEAIEWLLRDVGERSAHIEIDLPGALVTFRWSFEAIRPGFTRIRQAASLSGPRAADYVEQAQTALASGIPEGMRRLAEEIGRRHKKT